MTQGAGNRAKNLRRWLVPALRALLLALLIIAAFLLGLRWSSIDAQARALVVLSAVLDTAVLTPSAAMLTGEPRLDDTHVAGNPALVVRPAGEGPWPAIFLVNGAVPEGRELPEIRRLAKGLARAGYLVVVPDLPGLRRDTITPETASEAAEVAEDVCERPEALDGKVGLVGISTGATLALLAAAENDLEGRVSVVAAVAPYADMKTVLNVATTGHYLKDGEPVRYAADPFLSYAIARSLISALPPGEDRETLLSELDGVDRMDPRPLENLRARELGDLGADARRVVELLANEDPERFARLYTALPQEVRADLEALSPLAGEERIGAPVEVVTGPRDKYFPASESYAITRVAPDSRVTVTGVLDHAELSFSLQRLPQFLEMNGFVVRSLREARA